MPNTSKSNTWETRYGECGVAGYIRQYAQETSKDLKVVDVGCSDGTALRKCKEYLESEKITLYTVGIDEMKDEENKKKANKNLDVFISDKIQCVNQHIGEADVVICIHVINRNNCQWYKRDSNKIFQELKKFLKPGGILIADAWKISSESKKGLKIRKDFSFETPYYDIFLKLLDGFIKLFSNFKIKLCMPDVYQKI